MAIKAQLETEPINDNKTLLEAINNCTITDNTNFEKTSDLHIAPDMSDNNTCREILTDKSERSLPVDRCAIGQKEASGKLLRFAQDAKDTESKPLKRQPKQYDYPIISIPDIFPI